MSNMARALRVLCGGLALAAAARSQAGSSPVPVLEAQLLAGGLDAPAWAGSPQGDEQRVFALELEGRVRIVKNGVLLPTPFLDITDKAEQGAQSGLLGLAFHPDFARNGWFYVYYSISGSSSMLERYTVSAHDPDLADPSSALPMLFSPIVAPVQYHMGGGMDFGPDGMLYLAIGDERDSPTASCASQHLDSLLGKLLRLTDEGGIPADNPFVDVHGARPEIWDLGLREPYRMAFDRETGDLYIGDVGEAAREEIDVHRGAAPGGINWGWRVMEGELCTGDPQCAAYPCPSPTYAPPVFAFPHENQQCCVLGCGVYRGALVPALQGAYLYGEHCTNSLFALSIAGGVVTGDEQLELVVSGGAIDQLVSVGTDSAGELLLVDHDYGAPGQGEIWRVAPAEFKDLGGALGRPSFAGQGAALSGTRVTLTLSQALPGAPAHLVVGVGLLASPFKGGIMMPNVGYVLSGLAVGADGELPLSTIWPSGLPPGTPVLLQWWIADPAGPAGFTASNALLVVAL